MKLLILIVLFAGQISFATAQKMWGHVTIREQWSEKYSNDYGDTTYYLQAKGFHIRPAFGFGIYLGKRAGITVELGYMRWKTSSSTQAARGTKIEDYLLTNYERSYYFCPSVFYSFDFDKYRIITSLRLPVEYINTERTSSRRYDINKVTNAITYDNRTEFIAPDWWHFGLHSGFSFQRKIVKGLYAGPQLSLGYTLRMRKGDYGYRVSITDNSVVTTEEKTNMLSQRDIFYEMQPGFVFGYFF